MTYERHPAVDTYIEGLPQWQRAICAEVRDLVHAADPEVVETIKRRVLPYFVLEGNVCALMAAKDHVNVFLYDGTIVPDPEGHHHGGPRRQDRAHGQHPRGRAINARALQRMFEQIIANNRAGGWRSSRRPAAGDILKRVGGSRRMRTASMREGVNPARRFRHA